MLIFIYGTQGTDALKNFLMKKFKLKNLSYEDLFVNDKKIKNLIHGVIVIDNIDLWNEYSKYYMSRLFIIFSLEGMHNFERCINILSDSQNCKVNSLSHFCTEKEFLKKIEKIQFYKNDKIIYYMEITIKVANIHSCCKRNVGAIIVNDDRIISTGYNGTPKKILNCTEKSCEYCSRPMGMKMHVGDCICIHAELSALIYPSNSYVGASLFTTVFPCRECTKHIIQCGIKKVYYLNDYKHNDNDELMRKLFKNADIKVYKIKKTVDPISYEVIQK